MTTEEIGYIKATVETNKEDVKELKELVKEFINRQENKEEDLKNQIRGIEDQLNLYRHFVWFIKALSWTCVFILAFKFGDIESLWKGD